MRRQRLNLFPYLAVLTAGPLARVSAAPPPAPWTSLDIGTREAPGSVDLDTRGLWTLRATNGDVLQSVDSSFFVCQPLSSDGSVVALLLGQEGGDPTLARAGVMIRESDSEGARNIFLGMTTGQGIGLTYRLTANQAGIDEGAGSRYGPRQFPVWLRLQREGEYFTPFTSSDGYGWTQVHVPIPMAAFSRDTLAGLAASSRFSGPMTAVFNNPTVAPGQVSPIVQATTGNGSVLLQWPPVSSAVGYIVRRSAPTTPGFAAGVLTPTPIQETSFTDKGLPNGKPFLYLVSSVFNRGGQMVEGWATSVAATPIATPANLLISNIDLEYPRLHGGLAYDEATSNYTITGAGGDIWDTADRCCFASKLVTGDFQITAQILDRPGRKAGVMIRESLDGPARMVLLAGTAASGVVYNYRDRPGGAASWPGRPAVDPKEYPGAIFVRLVRRGATMAPFLSTDGVTFTPAGAPRTFNPPLADTLYAGYAVTSQSAGSMGTSTFRDLTIGPAP